MDQDLHKVTQEELPVLRDWLGKYIPESFKMYGTACLEASGKWSGTTFYTLGWPNILAAGEGPVDPATSSCAEFFNNQGHVSCYSPSPQHLQALLTKPEFIDWTQPIIFAGISKENAEVVQRISDATGTQYNRREDVHLMAAKPGGVKPIPVPDGFKMCQLDPDVHTEYVNSTWIYRRSDSDRYIHALIKSFPSLGLFNRNGELLAWETSSEHRTTVMLYVKEEARRFGLGQCIASHMAHKHLEEYGSSMAAIVSGNKPSINMHLKIGYTIVCPTVWFEHTMTNSLSH